MNKGEKFSGFTFDGEWWVCDKCGHKAAGVIPMAIHWNDCIDEGKTLAALKEMHKQKGDDLTIEDIDKVLPK